MCRIFGFRSVINSKVHSSLIEADNALLSQSRRHPDGWGVAYYTENIPHLIKSTESAFSCNIFQQISGVVASHTVLAHIRNATHGDKTILNSHPFQYGQWTFVHNGNIKNFDALKPELEKLIHPSLKRYILGKTDSEMIFYFFLSKILYKYKLSDQSIPTEDLFYILQNSIGELVNLTGKLKNSNDPIPTENYLTFVLTNGPNMIGFQGGQPLYYCTYKKSCPEKDTCDSFAPVCEAESVDGNVNHLIFSSEQLAGQNVWNQMKPGSLVGINGDMNMKIKQLNIEFED